MIQRYRLSFTTGGLFVQQAPLIAECFQRVGSWKEVRSQMKAANLLQVRTAAAATRIGKEVSARLEGLSTAELEWLVEASRRDQAYLLWVAACRRYAFIRDFALEVLREQYLVLRRQLTFADYDSYYSGKALWHIELDEIAPSTQLKLRQNLFRMLREADLLSDQSVIHPAQLSPHLAQLLAARGKDELLIFPATDNDIQRWLQ
ncbi:MAG: DUF1819 family protein [Burkholderiales bacterium]|nr:DUF1819 family protein [Burkholderiales bacterium]